MCNLTLTDIGLQGCDAISLTARTPHSTIDNDAIEYAPTRYTSLAGGIMKTAKLFQNGQSQAVRLPKEFRFEGGKVFIKKTGNAVVLIPAAHSWDSPLDSPDNSLPTSWLSATSRNN